MQTVYNFAAAIGELLIFAAMAVVLVLATFVAV